ncbi:hypothetical protein GCM10011378_08170 [Hymenobacter glacieicola]|uniref:Uncharacterized protein n=1 Tax=Hymenobacter glacieicola TaxID=1562124 RepID=A0ABQ1WMC5_9BACT|nr:hypothetical protein GCM10011378_08170 [Hymenobacter glacieicola]
MSAENVTLLIVLSALVLTVAVHVFFIGKKSSGDMLPGHRNPPKPPKRPESRRRPNPTIVR